MKQTVVRRLFVAALLTLGMHAQAEVKTIKDVLGRDVKVDVPVKNAVLGFYYPDYIAVTGVENFKHIAGISREFWEKFNPGSWALFSEKMPQLKNIADVGNVNTGTFSTEKTLALKPDVLILAEWQYQTLASELPRIEQAGVPIVVVDFNAQTVERHTQSARIFGQLAGTEARAEKIAKEYADGIADIQKRVKDAKQPKPKIYIEFGNKGPGEYSFTFGKNMWGAIADMVGGDNISAPFVENWGPINAEQLLTSKPEVVIISGTEMGHDTNAEMMSMGIGISEDDAQHRLKGFTQRPGWNELPAVKNHRVYGMYHTASRSMVDLASAQFMAKTLYPQAFADVDPQKTFMDFHKNYLPITPTGTFFIQLK
ncbi:ABC transporter substrate-binding protein [Aggregatibacter actinomycetemcomitans]|nr:ABC transporter substrate-binding protein [Aggregatibacter actinomycetemcomitans]